MPSIVIADDHPLMVRGLLDLMSTAPEFLVVGTAGTGRQALSHIETLAPDLALLDLSMPDLDGLAVQRAVREQGSAVRTVILGATPTRIQITEAIELGVWGLVLKEHPAEMVLECLRRVAAGHHWLPPERTARLIAQSTAVQPRGIATLTQRERDVARNVCEGLSNRAIAARLLISDGTVGMHLQNIYSKLGVSNRTMLAALHLRHELTDG